MKNIALQSYNRPTEAEKKDRVIAGIGTAGYAVCIFLLAFLLKDCGGGGGGNGGTGDGYMSLDVAGVGTMVDGYGFEENIPTPEVPVETPVSDETPAITDDTPNESAPVVDNSKPNTTKPKTDKPKQDKPQDPKPKPDPKVSNALNDAIKNMGGNGNTNGNGQQGTENGNPNGNGTTNGGGSAGSGSGIGGGNGTGSGQGTGSGSGTGTGGNKLDWSLSGRSISKKPSLSEVAPDEGTVYVEILVDRNGNVVSAKAIASKSNTSNSKLYTLAEQAAKKAKFSVKTDGPTEQKGSINITFKLK
jgi:TonB family protein